MNAISPPADGLAAPLAATENLIRNGRLREAAQQLQAMIQVAPNDARVHLMAARMAEAGGQAQHSIDAARNAVACAPGWSVAVTELALALARANQLPEALATARKAIELDPQNPSVVGFAVDVAHRALQLEQALDWLRRLAELAPGKREVRQMIARDLRLLGRLDEAIAAFGELVANDPADAASRLGRLQAALQAGQSELAQADAAALLQARPDDEIVRFWHEVAHGRTPERQPTAMVAELYDGLAANWDQHIVGNLKYKLPKVVAERIRAWHPDLGMNVLDLGCGTGLLGACLGPTKGAQVGVDISPAMIQQAARHNVYDKFHQVDVLDALAHTPADLYEVVVALDVFVYTGAVARAIPDAHRIVKPGGRFVFSCELAGDGEADGVLRATMRYAHQPAAIEALCRQAGFAEVEVEQVPLRYEGSELVQGFLVTARKAG